MPYAPSSASLCTASIGSGAGRVASPNGSLAFQPTVHRPNENLSSRVGWTDTVTSTTSICLLAELFGRGVALSRRARAVDRSRPPVRRTGAQPRAGPADRRGQRGADVTGVAGHG